MGSGLMLIQLAACGADRPMLPLIGVPADVTEHDLVGWKVEPSKDRAGVVHYTQGKAGLRFDVALGEGRFWRATVIGSDAEACAGLSGQTAALGEPTEAVCADRAWVPVIGDAPMYLTWSPGAPCIFGASREPSPLVAPPLGDKADVRGVRFGTRRADIPGLAPVTRELVNEPSLITPEFLALMQAKAAREGKPIPCLTRRFSATSTWRPERAASGSTRPGSRPGVRTRSHRRGTASSCPSRSRRAVRTSRPGGCPRRPTRPS